MIQFKLYDQKLPRIQIKKKPNKFVYEQIHVFVLNMDKNKDRWESIQSMLNTCYGCKYTRVSAIDGTHMNTEQCTNLLHRLSLIGTTLTNGSETWTYDGTPATSFPNTELYGHWGTKGLTVSNIYAMMMSLHVKGNWVIILEDDAEINNDVYQKIVLFLNEHQTKDIVLLDNRHDGWGGTAGMAYHKRALKKIMEDLHPLSEFSIHSNEYGDPNLGNLWDWKLWKYVSHVNKNFECFPCIDSGKFETTIK
jgi:hypothetical protein